jgi:hypothetical protein
MGTMLVLADAGRGGNPLICPAASFASFVHIHAETHAA